MNFSPFPKVIAVTAGFSNAVFSKLTAVALIPKVSFKLSVGLYSSCAYTSILFDFNTCIGSAPPGKAEYLYWNLDGKFAAVIAGAPLFATVSATAPWKAAKVSKIYTPFDAGKKLLFDTNLSKFAPNNSVCFPKLPVILLVKCNVE